MATTFFKLIGVSALALGIFTGGALADDQVKKGKKLFKFKCGICHSTVKGKKKIGPSLYDIVGRKSGTMPKYAYLSAMKNADLTWNDSSLDEYLTNPKKKVPGTKMSFPGFKKERKRTAVIAYLKTLK